MKKSNFTMKSKELWRIFPLLLAITSLILMVHLTQAQIYFVGMAIDGEGAAAWNADGTGPEPAGTGPQIPFPGFGEEYYYGASRDYIEGNPDGAGGHVTDIAGFHAFAQALTDNGFAMSDVKVKTNVYNMGDYSIGGTCFVIGDWWHSLFFDQEFVMTIGGEDAITGTYKFIDVFIHQFETSWKMETSFTKPEDVSGNSSPEVQAVVAAFFEDLGEDEIRYIIDDMTYSGQNITGNGRDGAFYNIVSSYVEKGKPTIPFNGLSANHQGSIGWSADGTGPEPIGVNSPVWHTYYASRDYDDVDPDPNAAYGSLEEEMKGFLNFKLQLLYRGFTPDQVLIKSGLSSIGDHVDGIDWSSQYGWVHYYGWEYFFELNGETIIDGLTDTVKAYYLSLGGSGSIDIPRDVTANASEDAQWIAGGFMKDLEERKVKISAGQQTFAPGTVSGNGRSGNYYNVLNANIIAQPHQATFIQCDTLFSNPLCPLTWSADCSPYYIDQDVVLPEGETLIIHPGVKVAFRGPYIMDVDGVIHAEGTEEEPILFTRSNWEPKWNAIIYNYMPEGADSSWFRHCIFEHAYAQPTTVTGYNSGAAFKVAEFDKILFDHCVFQHNVVEEDGTLPPSGAGLALWDASVHIKNTIFRYNRAKYGGGLICYLDSDALIEHCLFHDNHATSYGGAIEVFDAAPTFKNNTVINNTCLMYGGGFDIGYDSDTVVLENNIIYGNMRVNGTFSTPSQVAFRGDNNVVSLNYNDIEEGIEAFTGNHTISQNKVTIDEDPMFCWPEDMVFSLAFESPCCSQPGCPEPGYMGAYEAACFVSLPEATAINEEMIYPNPTVSGTVRLTVFIEKGDQLKVEIYDLLGHKVAEPVNEWYGAGEQEIILPVDNLSPGTYTIKIISGNEATSAKLIKI
jgi:hypothetical protein